MILTRVYRKYQNSITLRAGWWYTVATFAQKGVVFLSVLIFSNLLTPAEYGTAAVFFSWQGIFTVLFALNVYSSLGNARFEFDAPTFKRYKSSILSLGWTGCLVVTFIFALLPGELLERLFGLPKSLVMLAAFAAMMMLPVQMAMVTWRFNFKHVAYNLVNFLTTAYGILISVALILLPTIFIASYDRAIGRIIGNIVPYILAGLFLSRRIWIEGQTFYDKSFWRYALTISIPLIFHSLSNVLLDQFDRLMINQYIGATEAGMYTLAYQFGDIGGMLWAATNNVWVPWFFRQMEQKTPDLIRKRSRQYALAFAGITIVLIIIGPLFIRFFGPQKYWGASSVVPVVMATGFFTLLYSFYANVEFYEKKTGYIALMTALSAIINVALNAVLLPIYGYKVAGWTTLVAYIALFLLHAYVAIFRLKRGYLFNFWQLAALGMVITLLSGVIFTIANSP
jgi:O-antigen/teichoic acid export membrane protein